MDAGPPAIVVIDPSTDPIVRGVPTYEKGGKTIYVLGISVSGDRPLLKTIEEIVEAEGWQAKTGGFPDGPGLLVIMAKGKTMEQVNILHDRLSSGKFGAVKAELFIPLTEADLEQ